MKKIFLLFLALQLLILTACGVSADTPPTTTTAPATNPPETTVPPTTVPPTTVPETTVPETTAPESLIYWEIPDYPQLSYEEYFSETRYYHLLGARGENVRLRRSHVGWNNGTDKCETWMQDGLVFAGSSIFGPQIQVTPEAYEDLLLVGSDEQWVYAIKDHTELFRMDYYGENRQTLFVDESQKIAAFDFTTSVYACDGCVLFFMAGAGEDYGIYRLYLPDMTLDLLYTTPEKPYLYAPYSSHEITWSSDNPEYADSQDPTEIDYYYNTITGELLEHPVYGDRSWGLSTWTWWLEEE